MKKSYLLAPSIMLALFLILGLSGCLKKAETENQSQEVGNQEVNVQETGSRKQNISIDGPIISDLKPGDKIGDYVIKEINGILCQSNCKTDPDFSGSISFEGEHVVTGKFYYSPEYPIKISFKTNTESKMPELKDNFNKKIIELLTSNPSISLMNQELLEDNFSMISTGLPGFADFVKARISDNKSSVFDQEVTIKIKNYKTSLLAAGEAGPSAELVGIVKTDNQIASTKNQKECNASNLFIYTYPVSWGECLSSSNGEVTFRTDYSKYKVDLVLSFIDSTKEQYEKLKGVSLNGVDKLDNISGEFYEIPTGGSLMYGGLKIGEKYYSFVYNIKSNQPSDPDVGLWVADHNVTYGNMISILKSMKSVAE